MDHDIERDLNLFYEGLELLGLALDAEQQKQFHHYVGEVYLFNGTYRLVGAMGRDFVIKHLLDSIAPVALFRSIIESFPHDVRLCDVGSGAGLPGIPLAIMLPETPVVLVERMGRRAGFLQNALARCNLHGRVEVIQRDLNEVQDRFEIVTFRAFHPLTDIIRPIGSIVADRGFVCAYKGRTETLMGELAGIDALVRDGKGGSPFGWLPRIESVSVPFLEAQRTLCVLQKEIE